MPPVDEFPTNEGPWSPEGRTMARQLGKAGDQAWLRAERDGVESFNKGGTLQVRNKPTATLAAFTFGRYGGGTYYVWSWNGNGRFSRNAAAPPVKGFDRPSLFPIGDGTAFAISEFSRFVLVTTFLQDELEEIYQYQQPYENRFRFLVHNVTWYLTDGYKITPDVGSINSYVSGLYITNDFYEFSTTLAFANGSDNGRPKLGWCYTYPEPETNQLVTVYCDTTKNGITQFVSRTDNQLALCENTTHMGPRNLLCLIRIPALEVSRYYEEVFAGYPRIKKAALPDPSFFRYSRDGGTSWQTLNIDGLWDDEAKTLACDISKYNGGQYDPGPGTNEPTTPYFQFIRERNDCLQNQRSQGCALGASRGILFVMSTYRRGYMCQYEAGQLIPRTGYMAKVKIAVVDFNSGTVSLTRTLFENDDTLFDQSPLPESVARDKLREWPHAYQRWHRGIITVKGGVLLQYNKGDWPNSQYEPVTLEFSPDGIEWVETGKTPFAAIATGIITCSKVGQLICPMHDGEAWALYTSANMGRTWSRAAIITDEIAAWPGYDDITLETWPPDFARVDVMRRNGAIPTATPGAPWASNDRLPAPP